MSPTFLRFKNFRFYVNSREETRKHIHVHTPDGEVKIWLQPKIKIAENYGVRKQDLKEIIKIINERNEEFKNRWDKHFDV